MLRLFFLALTAVAIVAVGYVVIPRNTSRPDPQLRAAAASQPDPNAFVVRDAPPATAPLPPVPTAPQPASAVPTTLAQGSTPAATPSQTDPAATANLDSLMQRLRASSDAGPTPAPAQGPIQAPVQTPVPAPGPLAPAPQPVSPPTPAVITPPPPAPPTSRWTNVTAQGARWHMTPSGAGYAIAIDLGGGRVAEVHVAPAFANLDSAGMNQRVDYLKQTILQNFPPESASYTFARDGSVSLNN